MLSAGAENTVFFLFVTAGCKVNGFVMCHPQLFYSKAEPKLFNQQSKLTIINVTLFPLLRGFGTKRSLRGSELSGNDTVTTEGTIKGETHDRQTDRRDTHPHGLRGPPRPPRRAATRGPSAAGTGGSNGLAHVNRTRKETPAATDGVTGEGDTAAGTAAIPGPARRSAGGMDHRDAAHPPSTAAFLARPSCTSMVVTYCAPCGRGTLYGSRAPLLCGLVVGWGWLGGGVPFLILRRRRLAAPLSRGADAERAGRGCVRPLSSPAAAAASSSSSSSAAIGAVTGPRR